VGGAVFVASRLGGAETAVAAPSDSRVASPSPTPTFSVSPTPTKTVGADGLALPGFVTNDPSLPSASELTDGVWKGVSQGWVLASYSPLSLDGSGSVELPPRARNIVYLVSPGGRRYQALELPADSGWRLVSWRLGDEGAVFCRPKPDSFADGWGFGCADFAHIDLRTGDVSPSAAAMESAVFRGLNDAGNLLFVESRPDASAQYGFSQVLVVRGTMLQELASIPSPGSWLRVSPSGALGVIVADAADFLTDLYGPSAFVTVNLDNLAVEQHTWSTPDPGATCRMIGWASAQEVLIVCEHPEFPDGFGLGSNASTSFWSLGLAPGATAKRIAMLGEGIRDFGAGGVAAGRVVVLTGPIIDGVGGNTMESVAVVSGDAVADVPPSAYGGVAVESPDAVLMVGNRAYVVWGDPGEGEPALYLSVYDPSTGNATVLIPPGPVDPQAGFQIDNMTGCVLVGYSAPCM
jgi:hypothetical protein